MRLALFLALIVAALPALAIGQQTCPNGNCPAAFTSAPAAAPRPTVAMTLLPEAPPPTPSVDAGTPAPPPAPPAIVWEVWGFKLEGNQWVKQPDHCLKTTDMKQAIDYFKEIMRFRDWLSRDNLPGNFIDGPTSFSSPTWLTTPASPPITFTVWAFQLKDGKWVKDDKYCWVTGDYYTCRLDALEYAKRVNAVPGWRATTNAPDGAPVKTVNYGAPYHGPAAYADYSYSGEDYGYGGPIGTSRGGYPVYSEHGGRTIQRPHMTIRLGADADWSYRHTKHPDPIDP
jgi:hypothetical protein